MAATWLAAGGKLPFGVKPPQPVINRGHPLAQGLVFDVQYQDLGNTSTDLAYGARGTFSGTASNPGVGPHGALRTFLPSSTAADTYTTAPPVNGLTRLSIEAVVRFTGPSNVNDTPRLLWKGGASGRLELGWAPTDQSVFFNTYWSASMGEWNTPTSTAPQNAWLHVVVAYDYNSTSNDPLIWVNGIPLPVTRSTAPAGSAVADTTALYIGNRATADRAMTGNISHVRIWNRCLNQGEVAQLYSDPFQIYVRPAPLLFWTWGAAGAIFNVVVDATLGTAGAVRRQTTKSVAAMAGGFGAVQRQTSRAIATTAGTLGTVRRRNLRVMSAVAGTLASAGRAVPRLVEATAGTLGGATATLGPRVFPVTVAAVAGTAGAVRRQAAKGVSAAAGTASAVVRSVPRVVAALAGTLGSSGAIAVKLLTIQATTGTAGAVRRGAAKGVSATAGTAAAVGRLATKSVLSVAGSLGAVLRLATREVLGAAGTLGRAGRASPLRVDASAGTAGSVTASADQPIQPDNILTVTADLYILDVPADPLAENITNVPV